LHELCPQTKSIFAPRTARQSLGVLQAEIAGITPVLELLGKRATAAANRRSSLAGAALSVIGRSIKRLFPPSGN
jgi:hypothetical protein